MSQTKTGSNNQNHQNPPIHLTREELKAVKHVLECTIRWTELPFYEHEYQALKNVLKKIS